MEQTFIMIKSDGVQRRLIGEIVRRFELKGLKIAALKLISMSDKQAKELYSIHKGKPFYDGLVKFITSSPVVVMVVEGDGAIAVVRKLLGATFGYEAEPGTVRGDFGMSRGMNLVHGSDSLESAKREIPIFFRSDEILSYTLCDSKWVCETQGE